MEGSRIWFGLLHAVHSPQSELLAMDSPILYRPGLRPTLRHLMILCLHVAIVAAVFRSVFTGIGQAPLEQKLDAALGMCLLNWFMLPALVLLLDRRGPARSWYALVVFNTFMMASIGAGGWLLFYAGVRPRLSFRNRLVEYAFPVLFVVACAQLVLDHFPATCPVCRTRSLVPVEPVSRNRPQIRWCARCLRRSYKDLHGQWRPNDLPARGN
jgi:hypothetical protein